MKMTSFDCHPLEESLHFLRRTVHGGTWTWISRFETFLFGAFLLSIKEELLATVSTGLNQTGTFDCLIMRHRKPCSHYKSIGLLYFRFYVEWKKT